MPPDTLARPPARSGNAIPSSPAQRARELIPVFRERADAYDRDARFPKENFADLQDAGLLAANVPRALGGLGLGVANGDPLGLWSITRAIASGDPATAQPYHVHTNEVEIISALADEEQRERFLRPVAERHEILGGYGSQRPGGAPVVARRDGDGWRLDGDKYFATNSAVARHALVWATIEGAAGEPLDRVQLFYVRHDQPGIELVPGWWEQFQGLRATESHQLRLRDVRVPARDAIGRPGDYTRLRVQSRCYAHFAASFIGIADRLIEEQVAAVARRGREGDPIHLRRLGRARASVDAVWSLLERTARAYVEHDPAADTFADSARYLAERALRETWDDTLDSAGTAAFSDRHGLAKLNRDIPLYVRHESVENVLAAIGSDVLGRKFVNPAGKVVVQ